MSAQSVDAQTLTVAGVPAADEEIETLHIEVIAGPEVGAAFDVIAGPAVIGTHESATVRLTDRTVSRFHCELSVSDHRVLVKDLASRNGTYIEGVSIREALCPPTATIVLGESRLSVRPLFRRVAAEAPSRARFGRLTGRAAPMRRVVHQLERVAASDATVLLLGETGTGKEVTAESIHHESGRAKGPFVVVDCGAIPAELLESELFGHERGAFTGAVRSREGAFSAAHGGTIFLDEIGELPRDLQPKLLRALSRRAVKPVGGEAYVDVDVRVIAATNRDLRAEVNADRFRGDLYYRLAVVEVRLPALRDRLEDIPSLVEDILRECRISPAEHSRLMSASFIDQLRRHAWPGNIRELRNVVERALAMGLWDEQPSDAPPAPAEHAATVDLARPFMAARDEWTARFERAYLAALLEKHGGNVRASARAAGIDRVHLYRLLGRHGLQRSNMSGADCHSAI
jgi:two-component system, NtrC family, response regulator GlrR